MYLIFAFASLIGIPIRIMSYGSHNFMEVISHDEFVLKNNVLKEYSEIREEIKSLKT